MQFSGAVGSNSFIIIATARGFVNAFFEFFCNARRGGALPGRMY